MLGERRSNSLFAPAAPAEPERKPEQVEVHDISFEERTGRSLFAEATTAPRASELFFALHLTERLRKGDAFLLRGKEEFACTVSAGEPHCCGWHDGL